MSDKPPTDDPATKVAADPAEAERLAARAARLAAAKAAKAKKAAEGGDTKPAKASEPRSSGLADPAKADATPAAAKPADASATTPADANAAKPSDAPTPKPPVLPESKPAAAKPASNAAKPASSDAKPADLATTDKIKLERKKLPVVDEKPAAKKADAKKPETKAARTKAGGWAAFTDGGTAPKLVIAARVVMVLAFAATIPTILGVEHGNRLTWTVAVASLPFFWMTFGYHLWRRICPLAVMGQIGRLLGRPGTRKMGDWMSKNYLLVQLGIMVVALTLRLLATNGSHVWLAVFLGLVTCGRS